jgi:uncharacterized protein (TIGR02147 family)
MALMNDIFTYSDYRKLLADYYAERKKRNPWFSYQVFADKAGIANKGFLYNVIRGSKSLSPSSALKLSTAMKLSDVEARYFENLVSFNQAKNQRERNYFFEKLSVIKSDTSAAAQACDIRAEELSFNLVREAVA